MILANALKQDSVNSCRRQSKFREIISDLFYFITIYRRPRIQVTGLKDRRNNICSTVNWSSSKSQPILEHSIPEHLFNPFKFKEWNSKNIISAASWGLSDSHHGGVCQSEKQVWPAGRVPHNQVRSQEDAWGPGGLLDILHHREDHLHRHRVRWLSLQRIWYQDLGSF